MQPPQFILASASPRRRELLESAGYRFSVHPADIDESDHPAHLRPADLAEYLAVRKAETIAHNFQQELILAADTVVAIGDRCLGKPVDETHARQMLQLLSGQIHEVITGICLLRKSQAVHRSMRVTSTVKMKSLSAHEIENYVRSGLWKGKAGGYGIQDERNDPLVTRIEGSQTNIVGLPMEATSKILADLGIVPG